MKHEAERKGKVLQCIDYNRVKQVEDLNRTRSEKDETVKRCRKGCKNGPRASYPERIKRSTECMHVIAMRSRVGKINWLVKGNVADSEMDCALMRCLKWKRKLTIPRLRLFPS